MLAHKCLHKMLWMASVCMRGCPWSGITKWGSVAFVCLESTWSTHEIIIICGPFLFYHDPSATTRCPAGAGISDLGERCHSERRVHHLLICGNLQTASPTCLGTIGTPIRVIGEKEEGYLGTELHSRQCWLDGKGYKDLNGWNHALHRGIQRIGLWRGSAVKAFKGAK